MRKFGSKVIALQKAHRNNKFLPKGEEYVLVEYSQESKAYRLWKRGTRTVVKRRDVRFIENRFIQSQETKLFEASTNQAETEDKEDENEEKYKEEQSEQQEMQTTEHIDTLKTYNILIKKGRGCPKLIRDGKPGRPRKLYREMKENEEYIEPENVKEMVNSPEKDL